MLPVSFRRALLTLALLAPSLLAWQVHTFQADKDLPGFEAAGFSEWSSLYTPEEFTKRDGQELDPAALEGLRARWKEVQESAKKRIALIESDPRERAFWQLECRLARHSFFSKTAWALERPEPGFAVLVQHPAKEEPGYVARIVQYYLPFARKAQANFEELVARPAGLERQAGREITAFAVLASKGDFDNFTRFMQDENGYSQRSAYDYQLQLAVVYEDPFAPDSSVVAQHTSLCYRVLKELEHACLAQPGNRPGSMALDDGLAELFAAHEGPTPEALDVRSPRKKPLEVLVELLDKQDTRDTLLLPMQELFALRSWTEFQRAIAARVKRSALAMPAAEKLDAAYYAQAELWLNFLFDGRDAAHRAQLLEFVKSAFHGRGDAADLKRAFGITDLDALSREFLRWVCDEHERTHTGTKLDRAPIEGLFQGPGASAAAPSGSSPSAAAATQAAVLAPVVSPNFSPALLAPRPDDAQAQLALALLDARDGDTDSALRSLHSLAALELQEPWKARVARASMRVEQLAKLREGYLASLIKSGSKLSFKHEGKSLLAPVIAVENGEVRLGDNRLGLPSIPLTSLELYPIAKLATKPEQQGGAQPWARFYAYALAEDPRWEKLLKDDTPAARELREDAQSFPDLARVAGIARELYELSKLALPHESEDAAARIERVRKLLADHPGSALLARSMDALRALAKVCLVATRKPGDVQGLLHAATEPLEDGRTRLTWNFDAPEEALDWRRDLAHLKRWRAEFPKIVTAEADSAFVVRDGRFVGRGSVCYPCVARFEGPVTVLLRERRLAAKGESGASYFDVLLCDESDEQFIVVGPETGYIRVHDSKQNYEREARADEQRSYMLETDYDIKIEHDGKQVSLSVDDEPLVKAGCGPRHDGSVVLFAHSDLPISLDRIVIEGKLQAGSLHELEQTWLARKLTELGFP